MCEGPFPSILLLALMLERNKTILSFIISMMPSTLLKHHWQLNATGNDAWKYHNDFPACCTSTTDTNIKVQILVSCQDVVVARACGTTQGIHGQRFLCCRGNHSVQWLHNSILVHPHNWSGSLYHCDNNSRTINHRIIYVSNKLLCS